ncbi:MAG: formate--tetrahydrofolate ligase, partial [Bacteroidaceae bacterium]|nr:formate--tetrahydrofolate ligase [Bacteroidaceae bacterium]
MKTDIEIARSTPLVPVSEIAGQVGIPQDSLENYGKYVAKVPESLSDNSKIAR